jgi:nucleoside phosphorylase/GTPase SAR1 family protein
MNFANQIIKYLQRLQNNKEHNKIRLFAWLCGMRALPFLSIDREFAYWPDEDRQQHLYSIFRALDISAQGAFLGISDFADFDAAFEAEDAARTAAARAVSAAANAIVYAAKVTITSDTAAKSADYAAKGADCAASVADEYFNMETILLDDIAAITEDRLDLLNNDISLYGSLWYDFQEDLNSLGCSYWAHLYKTLFISRFAINKEELKRRLFMLPVEIKEQGAAAVGRYLDALGADAVRINEARIIILGDKGAGKTSIARKLIDKNAKMPEEYESTEGVETSLWSFPDKDGKNINAHIWDFAGHSITHSAHRCFMSERCLYIYVYNGRTERDYDPDYWLEQIRIHGVNSPVLFLINEKDNHRSDIAERTLKSDYPSIVGYYRVDIGSEDKTGLEKFRQTVMDEVRNNPSWNSQVVSAEAYEIKNELRELFCNTDSPHITRDEFEKIAQKYGVFGPRIEEILDDLHTLGICLWYSREDMEDFNTLVLNPDWITNGIYRIINRGFEEHKYTLNVANGVEILKDDERYKYPSDKVAYLFRLMRVYELAFFRKRASIFLPGILSKDRPDGLPTFNDQESLTMSFAVEKALPPNIVVRIIVQRNEYGEIYNEALLWRKGAALKYSEGDATVLIVENGQSIIVRVKGEDKTEYLACLRETIKGIFESYKKIKPDLTYDVLVPPVYEKTGSNNAIRLLEEEIRGYLQEGRPYFDGLTRKEISLAKTGHNYAINEKETDKHNMCYPFLFVTANENERTAFRKRFKNQGANYYVKGATYFCGEFGNYHVAWFHMPSQGTCNPDATILCGNVIEHVSPIAVVMVGIAFGADEENQKIGDVLVSKEILNYDSRKERNGTTQYKERPKESGYQLFNAFRSEFSNWWEYPPGAGKDKRFKVIDGAILTGSALVDDYKFRQKLLADFSDYDPVGGEMEGYGIYSQCRSDSISEWIIVKSICDWAYDKQNTDKDIWQKTAAASAVDYCYQVFSLREKDGKGKFDDFVSRWSKNPHARQSKADNEVKMGQEINTIKINNQFNIADSVIIQGDQNKFAFKSPNAIVSSNIELRWPATVTEERFAQILEIFDKYLQSEQAKDTEAKDVRALKTEIIEARKQGHEKGWKRLREFLSDAANVASIGKSIAAFLSANPAILKAIRSLYFP